MRLRACSAARGVGFEVEALTCGVAPRVIELELDVELFGERLRAKGTDDVGDKVASSRAGRWGAYVAASLCGEDVDAVAEVALDLGRKVERLVARSEVGRRRLRSENRWRRVVSFALGGCERVAARAWGWGLARTGGSGGGGEGGFGGGGRGGGPGGGVGDKNRPR